MENKEVKIESSMEEIKNILITLTDKTGFDHSPLALEAFAQAESDIQSEIDLAVAKAVAEKEEEIIWIIEDLRGFPADVLTEEQAQYIINLITNK